MLTFPRLIEALDAAHRRPKIEIRDTMFGTPEQCYFVRNAVDHGRYLCEQADHELSRQSCRRSLPAVQAVVVLFDARDGRPLAAMDGTEITYWRTAADSALGAKYLAREDAKTLLVVGAGAMAPWLVRAHRCARPVDQRVFCAGTGLSKGRRHSPDRSRAEGAPPKSCQIWKQAVRSADIITACTRTTAPLIEGEWLKDRPASRSGRRLRRADPGGRRRLCPCG